MSKELDYLGEGPTDDAIARKLIQSVQALPGITRRTPVSGRGKTNLDRRLKGINAGLTHSGSAILILRDMDFDASCPPALLYNILPHRHPNMLLRICVREAESWLLADADAYAKYCGIRISKIPQILDDIDYPKKTILSWVNISSRLMRHFHESKRNGIPEWAALAAWNLPFVEDRWDPVRAAKEGRSFSLCRTVSRLQAFVSL